MLTIFEQIDRVCGDFALALHNSEWAIYAAIGLLLTVTLLTFPPKDDPDQV
jgi:hypothetical protein